ncbi:LacI family DNA-binding transcriptional regulator [Rhizobium sp. AQ_MP]|uniref:LacI family DNA-binding transcriptional regulator n=1 Tax=Rhizobium sp. AQ_MP TaxID=2761536 RepID=UPI00163AB098|nr:LacI family DNA-binding transcriptional regulator [Rhizobium sp. AQ_MP]MBC2772808.1 LacI family DNA-binding transcriptional regulator [Rhizobium sp. AQ_MP]
MNQITRKRRQSHDKITLSDVAQKAGVSAITVSRALRDPEKVSPQLRDTILSVVEEMGYVPDLAARALASKNSGLVGVVAPVLTSHAFLAFVRGIEDRVRPSDLRIQYANPGPDSEDQLRQLRFFLSQNPAGLIHVGQIADTAIDDLLRRAPCPVVEVMDISREPADMAVGIDNRLAAETATRHLLDKGYRRIAMLGGVWDFRARRRLEGFKAVLEAAGLYDPALVLSVDTTTSVGLGCHLLDRLKNDFPDADAALCHNDDIALGALFESQRRGLAVPQDFGICGFNDLEYAGFAFPAITTVRVPRYEIGYRAVDLIIRATGSASRSSKIIDLGYQLLERGSTDRKG